MRATAFAVVAALVGLTAGIVGQQSAQAITTPTPSAAPTALTCTASTGILVSTGANGTSNLSTATVTNGVFSATKTGTMNELVNAIGYNPNDGYIYGMTTSSGGTDNQFVRFGSNAGAGETYLGVPTLADGTAVGVQYDAGVIASDDTWIGFARTGGSTTMTTIPIPASGGTVVATQTALTGATLSAQPRDVSFDPFDQKMYALMPNGFVYSITQAGVVTEVTSTTPAAPATWAGGSWTDSFGNVFFYQNGSGTTGRVFQFDPRAGTLTDVGAATAFTDFDATACLPVGMQKSVSPASVGPGGTTTFSFTLANPYATSVDVTGFDDPLPAGSGLTWVPGSLDTGGSSAFASSTTTIGSSGTDLTITPITLPAGSEVTFTAQAKVTTIATSGRYTNQASATAKGVTIVSDDPSLPGATEATPFTVSVPTPTANPDSPSTSENTPVTFDPSTNDADAPTGGGTIVPASTRLIDPTAGTPVASVTIADGRYDVDTTNGLVTFTPATGFTGTAADPVSYRITDTNGATAVGAITPAVTAVGPTANPDSATTTQGAPVTLSVTSNDTAGNAATPIAPGSVVLVAGSEGGTVSNGGKTLAVPNQGAYTVDSSGIVTFTPVPAFVGTATATYSVSDVDGHPSTAGISVAVSDVAPTAMPDSATTQQNTPVTLSPSADDTPGIAGGTPIDPSSVRLVDPGTDSPVTGLHIAPAGSLAGGTFAVDAATGIVTFAPDQGSTGSVPAVAYQVADTSGATARSTISVSVTPVAPIAAPDSASTTEGRSVTLDPTQDDLPGNAATPIDPTSVVLTPGSSLGVVSSGGRSLSVPGEGAYTVDPTTGAVTFAPDPAFAGSAHTIGYTIADVDGTTTSSTIAVTVSSVPPRAYPDAATAPQNTPVTFDPTANDLPGVDGGSAIDPTSVFLLDDSQTAVRTLTTAAGSYTVSPTTGRVTFTPDPTFTGHAPTISYRVADAHGASSTSTVDVVVDVSAPQAAPDTATTPEAKSVTLTPLSNDVAGNPNTPLDASTFRLTAPAGASLDPADGSVTVPGEGVYTPVVTGGAVAVTFAPDPAFAGTATPVGYTVSDIVGNGASSTLGVTVTPVPPLVTPDTARTSQNTPVTFDSLAGDGPGVIGGAALDPTSVVLGNVAGGTLSSDGKTLTAAAGTWTVDATTGAVTFVPAEGYSGRTPAVPYTVSDTRGLTATSTITITVDAVTPKVAADTFATPQGAATTIAVLDNDAPGNPVTPLVATSVTLAAPSGTSNATLSADRKTLTVPGQGIWAVQIDGTVIFTPVPSFTGASAKVAYTVLDVDGGKATASLTGKVTAIAPRVTPDVRATPQNTPVTISPLTDDRPGITGGSAIDPSTLVVIGGNGNGTTDFTDADGHYQVTTAGTVLFTPAEGRTGIATPVRYRVVDAAGATATSTITVTVTPVAPTASPDSATTTQNTPVTLHPLDNDTAGNARTPIDSGSVRLHALPGATASQGGLRLSVPRQGVWTVEAASGLVTFSPARGFSGITTPAPYTVADIDGTTAASTLTVSVHGVAPTAHDDVDSTRQGVAVTTPVVANDLSGGAATPLVAGSVLLTTTGLETVTDATLSRDARTLTVPGQGVYTVDTTTGAITFTPEKTFSGTATSIAYTVADVDGTRATATLTDSVAPAELVAEPDARSGPAGTAVTIDPLTNDVSPSGAVLDPTSVVITEPNTPTARLSADGRRLVVPGEGTYVVDPSTGAITFTPAAGFSGKATPISYSVADVDGVRVVSTVTVTIAAPPPTPAAAIAATSAGTAHVLAFTGSDAGRPVVFGLLMVLTGLAALVLSRRRRPGPRRRP